MLACERLHTENYYLLLIKDHLFFNRRKQTKSEDQEGEGDKKPFKLNIRNVKNRKQKAFNNFNLKFYFLNIFGVANIDVQQ